MWKKGFQRAKGARAFNNTLGYWAKESLAKNNNTPSAESLNNIKKFLAVNESPNNRRLSTKKTGGEIEMRNLKKNKQLMITRNIDGLKNLSGISKTKKVLTIRQTINQSNLNNKVKTSLRNRLNNL